MKCRLSIKNKCDVSEAYTKQTMNCNGSERKQKECPFWFIEK